jgi:hypothetical protein
MLKFNWTQLQPNIFQSITNFTPKAKNLPVSVEYTLDRWSCVLWIYGGDPLEMGLCWVNAEMISTSFDATHESFRNTTLVKAEISYPYTESEIKGSWTAVHPTIVYNYLLKYFKIEQESHFRYNQNHRIPSKVKNQNWLYMPRSLQLTFFFKYHFFLTT